MEAAAAALSLMEEALALLDRADFADEAGPHLDLAICRLRQALADRELAQPGGNRSLESDRCLGTLPPAAEN